jgi:hypothetical protein
MPPNPITAMQFCGGNSMQLQIMCQTQYVVILNFHNFQTYKPQLIRCRLMAKELSLLKRRRRAQ